MLPLVLPAAKLHEWCSVCSNHADAGPKPEESDEARRQRLIRENREYAASLGVEAAPAPVPSPAAAAPVPSEASVACEGATLESEDAAPKAHAESVEEWRQRFAAAAESDEERRQRLVLENRRYASELAAQRPVAPPPTAGPEPAVAAAAPLPTPAGPEPDVVHIACPTPATDEERRRQSDIRALQLYASSLGLQTAVVPAHSPAPASGAPPSAPVDSDEIRSVQQYASKLGVKTVVASAPAPTAESVEEWRQRAIEGNPEEQQESPIRRIQNALRVR